MGTNISKHAGIEELVVCEQHYPLACCAGAHLSYAFGFEVAQVRDAGIDNVHDEKPSLRHTHEIRSVRLWSTTFLSVFYMINNIDCFINPKGIHCP